MPEMNSQKIKSNEVRAYIKPVTSLKRKDYLFLIKAAIAEDKTNHDITTNAIFTQKKIVHAFLNTREDGILCGKDIFTDVFRIIDKHTKIEFFFNDGNQIKAGENVASLHGDVKSIFKAERIALNFISMLSGIATNAHKATKILKPFGITALDTRKTLPGFRMLSKYAVYMGGAANHRINLEQMGLIKDNHIAAAGSVKNAIFLFRKKYPDHKCEVEVESEGQLTEALGEHPEMIMLDNMNTIQIGKCVKIIRKYNDENHTNIICEASGGFNLENIISLAKTGIDFVSMGSLTNHISPLDYSLEVSTM